MAFQMKFKRYELKYLLTAKQKEQLLEVMKPYMELDQYGHSTIRNIYYDTDTFRLIRRSLEKPVYKEKLRVRSYVKANSKSDVFVELKKKYKSVVYKRRIALPEQQAACWLGGQKPCPLENQISREIDYFFAFYETLHPAVFLSYGREAFYSLEGGDFRITFDENILYRENDLSLESEVYGTPILDKNQILMELKTSGGIPLWMSHFLNQQNIRKTSFSKYGTAYQMMQSQFLGGKLYA
ncbi:MAG: polyphosphate polymerase domain-containing protein [Lachnospiraceae bacterium]|nr:polyphosphate polymerase domain-containing protein [Lachnospiraceae bacterium]